MVSDKTIGYIMTGVGIFGILLEFWVLFIAPLADDKILNALPGAQYWAMAIPIFLGLAGVLAIVTWIGITMVKTPPPEAMEFEDFDEVEMESTSKAKKEEPKKAKKAAKAKPKKEAKKKAAKAPKKEEKAAEPKEEVAETTGGAGDMDITEIKGIGASTADELRSAGFTSVQKIADASIEDLTQVKGVGKASAKKYIDNAKELL